MKNITLSVLAMVALSSAGFAEAVSVDVVEQGASVVETENTNTVLNTNAYVGLGLAAASTRNASLSFFDEEDGQDRTGDIVLLAGYNFSVNVAVEARYMTSFSQEDVLERSSWGIYVKPQYPVSEEFTVYALLGFGGFDAEGIDGAYIDVDDSGFQWGLGASYEVDENISIFVDYVSIANDADADIFLLPGAEVSSDAITLGVTYKF